MSRRSNPAKPLVTLKSDLGTLSDRTIDDLQLKVSFGSTSHGSGKLIRN